MDNHRPGPISIARLLPTKLVVLLCGCGPKTGTDRPPAPEKGRAYLNYLIDLAAMTEDGCDIDRFADDPDFMANLLTLASIGAESLREKALAEIDTRFDSATLKKANMADCLVSGGVALAAEKKSDLGLLLFVIRAIVPLESYRDASMWYAYCGYYRPYAPYVEVMDRLWGDPGRSSGAEIHESFSTEEKREEVFEFASALIDIDDTFTFAWGASILYEIGDKADKERVLARVRNEWVTVGIELDRERVKQGEKISGRLVVRNTSSIAHMGPLYSQPKGSRLKPIRLDREPTLQERRHGSGGYHAGGCTPWLGITRYGPNSSRTILDISIDTRWETPGLYLLEVEYTEYCPYGGDVRRGRQKMVATIEVVIEEAE